METTNDGDHDYDILSVLKALNQFSGTGVVSLIVRPMRPLEKGRSNFGLRKDGAISGWDGKRTIRTSSQRIDVVAHRPMR